MGLSNEQSTLHESNYANIIGMRFAKSGFFLAACSLLVSAVLGQKSGPIAGDAPIVTVPECPIEGYLWTADVMPSRELRISYYPSSPEASIKRPTSPILRLTFNDGESPDDDRTIPFQKINDRTWQAVVPLTTTAIYAIWYVRDDATGVRDDNHGKYWDLAFCGQDGRKMADAVRYQVRTYAGSIVADDIKRGADYIRAISLIEAGRPEFGYKLLDEEWSFKYRLHSQAGSADPALVAEIKAGLAQHSNDTVYLRKTTDFLIRFQSAFPATFVDNAVDIADRFVPASRERANLERERAESLKDPRERVNALGAWLIKYPSELFYDHKVRKLRLELFGELGDVESAEECYQDLVKRYPRDADLYVTMASIYVSQRIHLNRALELLDEAAERLSAGPASGGGLLVTLGSNRSANEKILNFWRGRTLASEERWAEAETLLAESVPTVDEAEAYAILGNVQEEQQEWTKAKDSYLEAAKRASERREKDEDVEKFVAVSLKAGILTRALALQELTGAQQKSFEDEHYTPTLVDMPLPDFTFDSQSGAKITPYSLRGKVVVLNLWATWCGPCLSELGGFDQLRQLHPEIVVLPVAESSSLADIKKVFESQGLKFDRIVTSDDQDMVKFGSNGVPQTYIVDGHGRIRIVHRGGLTNLVPHLEADIRALGASQLEQSVSGPISH